MEQKTEDANKTMELFNAQAPLDRDSTIRDREVKEDRNDKTDGT